LQSIVQGKLEDYIRADTVYKRNDLVYGKVLNSGWCSDNKKAWYRVQNVNCLEFMLLDTLRKNKGLLFDQKKFAQKYTELAGSACKPYTLPFRDITLTLAKNGTSCGNK